MNSKTEIKVDNDLITIKTEHKITIANLIEICPNSDTQSAIVNELGDRFERLTDCAKVVQYDFVASSLSDSGKRFILDLAEIIKENYDC